MSGHAILDSYHHCGKAGVELFVVHISKTSSSCGETGIEEAQYHHIHVNVACGRCKATIWDREE